MYVRGNIFAMKLSFVIWVIQSFFLSRSLCVGCDDKCDIREVFPSNSSVLAYLGEAHATEEILWFKLGDDFEKMVIQLKIDKEMDFEGERISSEELIIHAKHLFEVIPPSPNRSHWIKMQVNVVRQKGLIDTYDIVATVGEHSFKKETGLWWRFNTILAMQFLANGSCQVSLGCHPCNPAEPLPTNAPIFQNPDTSPNTADEPMGYITEPTGPCGPHPWIYILVSIVGILVLILIFLLLTIRYLYIKQKSITKRNIVFPYLEGNHFKEENIYDELKGKPKLQQLEKDNVYDEIGSRKSRLPLPPPRRNIPEEVDPRKSSYPAELLPALSSKHDSPFYGSNAPVSSDNASLASPTLSLPDKSSIAVSEDDLRKD